MTGLRLAGKPLAAMSGLAKVEAVLEQIGEGAIGERDAAGHLALDRAAFADDALWRSARQSAPGMTSGRGNARRSSARSRIPLD